MFCINCGTSLPDQARFCPSCGTQVAAAATSAPQQASPQHVSPPPVQAAPSPAGYATPQAPATPQQPNHVHPQVYAGPPSTALVTAGGQPTAAFQRLAGALFQALDQNIQPQRTGGIEVSKLAAYRTLGGLPLPPYYAEYVVPIYCRTIPIETVPGQSQPILTWNGWHQYLLQKFCVEPDVQFGQLLRVCAAFQIPVSFTRADLPMVADPNAQMKETRFRTEIYSLATAALSGGGGGGGFGRFGLGGGHGHSAGGGMSTAAAHAMLKMAQQGGTNILNASMPAGSGGFSLIGGGFGL